MQEEEQAKRRAASASPSGAQGRSSRAAEAEVGSVAWLQAMVEKDLDEIFPTDGLTDGALERGPKGAATPSTTSVSPSQGTLSSLPIKAKPLPQGELGGNDDAPLTEEEKEGLLSEWYSLVAKVKPLDSAKPAVEPLASSGPRAVSHIPYVAAAAPGDKGTPVAGPGQAQVRSLSSKEGVVGSDGMEVSDSASKEEEDAYVAAVLQNLELVSAKVEAAEAKMAKAVRLARSGDPAAKAASVAAEAQLGPLREQMEQLRALRESLQELSLGGDGGIGDEGAQPSWEGRNSGRGDNEGFQVAEVIEGPPTAKQQVDIFGKRQESPRPSPLPKPSEIRSAPAASPLARSWGSWGRNRRIQEADVSLIRQDVIQKQQQGGRQGQERPGRAAPSASAPLDNIDAVSRASKQDEDVGMPHPVRNSSVVSRGVMGESGSGPTIAPTANGSSDDGVTIVSKKAGAALFCHASTPRPAHHVILNP